MRTSVAILRKDLLLERRTLETIPSMAMLAVVTFIIFHFGLNRNQVSGQLAAGVLTVTLLFAAMLGINRLFVAEREQGGFDAFLLAPVDRTAMLVAKATALFLYLVVLEIVALPAFALFLAPPHLGSSLPGVLLILLIATARGIGPLLTAHATGSPPAKWLAVLALYDLFNALLAYAVFDFLLEE
jgi:heme exporter protein B